MEKYKWNRTGEIIPFKIISNQSTVPVTIIRGAMSAWLQMSWGSIEGSEAFRGRYA